MAAGAEQAERRTRAVRISVRRSSRQPHGRPTPVLTGRALVLGAVVVLLIVLLASPLRRYLGSREAVDQARAQLHSDRAAQLQLGKQNALWSDPGYIEQQARSRLQYAMPGDTVYTVVDSGQRSDIERTDGAGADVAGTPWTQRLWSSVQAADQQRAAH